METLEPIKKIQVSFGRPMEFSPPLVGLIKEGIFNIVKEWAAREDDALADEFNDWLESLTKEESQKLEYLTEVQRKAAEAYDPKVHGDDSDELRAYDDASQNLNKFKDSVGKHICFVCSSFCKAPAMRGEGLPYCEYHHRDLFVCPYTRACEHFTTGITDEMMEINEKIEEIRRRDPATFKKIEHLRRLDFVRDFVKELRNYPSNAFYRVKLQTEYYMDLYKEYKEEFAETSYPTLEEFKAAFEEWDRDCVITKDGNNVTLSISKEKFAPVKSVQVTTTHSYDFSHGVYNKSLHKA